MCVILFLLSHKILVVPLKSDLNSYILIILLIEDTYLMLKGFKWFSTYYVALVALWKYWYRIRENFRMSNFRITAKWNISNGFIFEFPARPQREKLRCPDA